MSTVVSVTAIDGKSEGIYTREDGVRFYSRTVAAIIDKDACIIRIEADFRIDNVKRAQRFWSKHLESPGVNRVVVEPYTITVHYGELFSGHTVANNTITSVGRVFAPGEKLLQETDFSEKHPRFDIVKCYKVMV